MTNSISGPTRDARRSGPMTTVLAV